jgi:hypothetical protein
VAASSAALQELFGSSYGQSRYRAADLILTMLDQRAAVADDVFPSVVGNWDNKYDNWHNKWPVSKILASIPEWNLGR